jgi:hypothetical protein
VESFEGSGDELISLAPTAKRAVGSGDATRNPG